MNDTELDQLLNTWSVPPVPASLRASVRAGFHARLESRKFPVVRVLIAAVSIGVFLLAVTLALPQTLSLISPPVRAPYVVESDVVRYAADGTSSLEVQLTSYNNNGSEIVLYEVSPSFLNTMWLDMEAAGSVVSRLTLPFVFSPEQLEAIRSTAFVTTGFEHYRLGSAAALLSTGCVIGPVVGHETILDHPTVAVRSVLDDRRRMTMWMAPDLGCFALRITTEERCPDGTFRLVRKKQATKVTLMPGKTAVTSRKTTG
jgi:hypothetical protein